MWVLVNWRTNLSMQKEKKKHKGTHAQKDKCTKKLQSFEKEEKLQFSKYSGEGGKE